MHPLIAPGSLVEFRYPAANCHGVLPRWERRRLRIQKVRDIRAEPLDPFTLAVSPALRRGQLLVTGLDLDKQAERSFYLDSMADLGLAATEEPEPAAPVPTAPGRHRIYRIDPTAAVPPELVFASDDRKAAIGYMREWQRDPLGFAAVLWPPGAKPPRQPGS